MKKFLVGWVYYWVLSICASLALASAPNYESVARWVFDEPFRNNYFNDSVLSARWLIINTPDKTRVYEQGTWNLKATIEFEGDDHTGNLHGFIHRAAIRGDEGAVAILASGDDLEPDSGRVYSLPDAKVLHRLESIVPFSKRGPLRGVFYSEDGKYIVGVYQRAICKWNPSSGQKVGCDLALPQALGEEVNNNNFQFIQSTGWAAIQGLAPHASGDACVQKTVIWNWINPRTSIPAFNTGFSCNDSDVSLDILPKKKWLITQGLKGPFDGLHILRFWDLLTGNEVDPGWTEANRSLNVGVFRPSVIRSTPDEQYMLIADYGNPLVLKQMIDGQTVRTFGPVGHPYGVQISKDNRWLIYNYGSDKINKSALVVEIFKNSALCRERLVLSGI
jgi:hypothetical protein